MSSYMIIKNVICLIGNMSCRVYPTMIQSTSLSDTLIESSPL